MIQAGKSNLLHKYRFDIHGQACVVYMVQGNLDQWNLFTNQVNYIYTRNVAKINNKLDTNF